MTSTTYITALSEGTGKTAIAAAMGLLAQENGQTVRYLKPLGTRLHGTGEELRDDDPPFIREVLNLETPADQMEPIVYSRSLLESVLHGHTDRQELQDRITTAHQALADEANQILAEGPGGLTTGGTIGLAADQVASQLDARVILVATYTEPADLDGVLAAADRFEERFAGVLFNRVDPALIDELQSTVVPFLTGRNIPVTGVIPTVPTLRGVTIKTLQTELNGELLTEIDDRVERRVEQYTVGTMSPGRASQEFQRLRNAAVVTGGDRSAIHAAAIQSSGVSCLIVTGGHRPSGEIIRRATHRNVPILSVPGDPPRVIDELATIISGGRIRSVGAVEQVMDLLIEHTSAADLFEEE